MDQINDSRLVQMIGLIFDAQNLGLELAREIEFKKLAEPVYQELINAIGHLVAAHSGIRDITKWPVKL